MCRRRRRGSVLILVVWVVALLGVVVAGLGSRGLFALGFADRLADQLQAYYAAVGGVQYAAAIAPDDPTPAVDSLFEPWRQLTPWMSQEREPVQVEIGEGLVDEERYLNLNTAPVEVLERVLRAADVPKGSVKALAAAIADWRDEDSRPTEQGAEDFDYRGGIGDYECKDGPFESVEELLLVKGMTPEVWAAIASQMTVYGSGRLNVNTADPMLLAALGVSEAGVRGWQGFRAGDDGREGTDDDRVVLAISALAAELQSYVPPEDLACLAPMADGLTVRGEAFRLTVTAGTGSAASRVRVMSVITRQGQVVAWDEA